MSQALNTMSAAMEPLLPNSARDQLAELTREVLRKAGALSAKIPSAPVREQATSLVREMNSYYSNLIEGHKTLPRDIERALQKDYSTEPETRANQHLARAHIEAENAMLLRLRSEPALSVYSTEFLCWLHRQFYERLPEELHWNLDRRGKNYRVEAGQLRGYEVRVGEHQPPAHRALPEMLAHFAKGYSDRAIVATDQLVALAAAHHRLAWIHPFGDGNGRVARLFSHACIVRAEVDSFGLWTLSRGLARQRGAYFASLAAADGKRWNDLDGRGNLSDRALAEFCLFFLRAMLDQIDFMAGLFEFETLARRIDRHLQFELVHLGGREQQRLSRLLRAALLEGRIERGRVAEIVGLRGTAARQIIRLALGEGLMDSPTEKGPLSIAFSSKTLESYFPKLYQDLPVDPAPAADFRRSPN